MQRIAYGALGLVLGVALNLASMLPADAGPQDMKVSQSTLPPPSQTPPRPPLSGSSPTTPQFPMFRQDPVPPVQVNLMRGPAFIGRIGWDLEGRATPGDEYGNTVIAIPFWDKGTSKFAGALRLWCHKPTKTWALMQFAMSPIEGAAFEAGYLKHDPRAESMFVALRENAPHVRYTRPDEALVSSVSSTRRVSLGVAAILPGGAPAALNRLLGANADQAFQIQLWQESQGVNRQMEQVLRVSYAFERRALPPELSVQIHRGGFAEVRAESVFGSCVMFNP